MIRCDHPLRPDMCSPLSTALSLTVHSVMSLHTRIHWWQSCSLHAAHRYMSKAQRMHLVISCIQGNAPGLLTSAMSHSLHAQLQTYLDMRHRQAKAS